MMKEIATVFDAMKPNLIWSKTVALTAITKLPPNIYQISYKYHFMRLAVLLTSVILVVEYAFRPNDHRHSIPRSSLVQLTRDFYNLTQVSTTILFLLISQLSDRRKIKSLQIVGEVDLVLREIGLGKQLKLANESTWKWSVAYLSTSLLILLAKMYVTISRPVHKGRFLLVFVTYVPHASVTVDACIWMIAVKKRFEILNAIVGKLAKNSRKVESFPINPDLFSNSINVVTKLHELLAKVSRNVNVIYHLPFLVRTGLSFLNFLTLGYKLMFVLSFTSSYTINKKVERITFYLVTSVPELVAMVHCSSCLCDQVSPSAGANKTALLHVFLGEQSNKDTAWCKNTSQES